MSNAFCKLIRTISIKRLESKPVRILFLRHERHVSVKWFLRNPNWYVYITLLSVRFSFKKFSDMLVALFISTFLRNFKIKHDLISSKLILF